MGLAVSRLGNELRDYDFVKKPKRTKIHVHRIKVTVSPFSVIPTLAKLKMNGCIAKARNKSIKNTRTCGSTDAHD